MRTTRAGSAESRLRQHVQNLVASKEEKAELLADEKFMALLALVEPLKPGTVALMFRDIEKAMSDLRADIEHVIADSPGTPDSVKLFLRKALDG